MGQMMIPGGTTRRLLVMQERQEKQSAKREDVELADEEAEETVNRHGKPDLDDKTANCRSK